jgi:hypothetical protein
MKSYYVAKTKNAQDLSKKNFKMKM